MAYVITWNDAYPDGATEDAKDIDLIIRNKAEAIVERMEDLFGFNITSDPLSMTKISNIATIVTKQLHQPEVAKATVAGAATLDFTVDGNTIAVTINSGPSVITLSNIKSGGRYAVRIINPSGFQFGFASANTMFTSTPRAWTATKCVFSFYSDGTVAYGFAGVGFAT